MHHGPVGGELRPVAGAVPRPGGVVPIDRAAHVGAPGRELVRVPVVVAVDGELLPVHVHEAAVAGDEIVDRAVHRLHDQDVRGDLVGDLVRDGAEEAPHARHPLVADDHELDVLRLGQVAEHLGRIALDGSLLDLDVLRLRGRDLVELDRSHQRVTDVDERDRARVHGGERVGLAHGLGGRPRAVGPGEDPHVGRGGLPWTGTAGRVDDQEVARRVVRHPVGNAPQSEPRGLPHPAVPDDDQVGVVRERRGEDRLARRALDQLGGRIDLLRTRRLGRLVQRGLERLPADPVGVEGADEDELAAEPLRERLRDLDGDGCGRRTVGADDDRPVRHLPGLQRAVHLRMDVAAEEVRRRVRAPAPGTSTV